MGLTDDINNFLFLLARFVTLGRSSRVGSIKDLVDFSIIEITSTVSNLLLQVVGGFLQLSLLTMLLLLLEILDSFMELFVLESLLLLLESLDLLLLLEESALDLPHVLVSL